MEMQDFEDKLFKMTKPEVSHLEHEDMLVNAITKAKDKSIVSWWWLAVPLYLISTLLMKSFFMPQTTLLLNIRVLTSREKYTSLLFFLVVPIVFIIINVISIRHIYILSGSPKTINFLKRMWYNVLIIILSALILIIYSL